MNIGERLLKLRKQKGLSQEEIANIIGVSRQTISKWETGESNPDFDKIIPLCDLYNITTDELIRGEIGNKEETVEEKDTKVIEDKSEREEDLNISYKSVKKHEALVVSISVFLYFISVVWIIFIESLNVISEELMISVFLVIVAIPTCLLIYYYISVDNKKKYLKEKAILSEKQIIEDEKLKKYKEIDDILALVFTIIYLYVSFVIMGWYITWIIWVVYSLVIKIVHLVLDSKRGDK